MHGEHSRLGKHRHVADVFERQIDLERAESMRFLGCETDAYSYEGERQVQRVQDQKRAVSKIPGGHAFPGMQL